MSSQINQQKLLRILDANFNRVKEGLRVCEDIFRFIFDDTKITRQLKDIRHGITQAIVQLNLKKIIDARDVASDVGQASTPLELKRTEISDILFANSQRVKESIRVLEEITKLLNPLTAEKFKKLRYQFYVLEKKMLKKS